MGADNRGLALLLLIPLVARSILGLEKQISQLFNHLLIFNIDYRLRI